MKALSKLKDPVRYLETTEGRKAESTIYDIPKVNWDETNLFLVNHPWLAIINGEIKAFCSNIQLAVDTINTRVMLATIANMTNDKFEKPVTWVQHAKHGKIYPVRGGKLSMGL